MFPNKYKPPRVHSGDLRTWVKFYGAVPNKGPEPGDDNSQKVYECWAKIEEVWSKDVELAKQNGTLSDVTLTIRDPHEDYRPTNKHYVQIDHPDYAGIKYDIKQPQPDPQQRDFIKIIAGAAT